MFQIYAAGGYDSSGPAVISTTAELDPIDPKMVGCLTQEKQKDLAEHFRFAQTAYNWLWDPTQLAEMLVEPHITPPPRPYAQTAGRWTDKLKQLEKWTLISKMSIAIIAMCALGLVAVELAGPLLVFSRFFVILKENGLGRIIFSGKRLSLLFKRPPSVHLPDLPMLLRRLSIVTAGKFFMLNYDFRHYFHQIAVGYIRLAFAVVCADVVYYWMALPMGWSYSPRIAQCYAWAAVLYPSDDQTKAGLSIAAKALKNHEHPPSFVILRAPNEEGTFVEVGLLFIWYDNVVAFLTTEDAFNAMQRHLDKISSRHNLQWGKNEKTKPAALSVIKQNSGNPASAFGVAIGIQFGYELPRGQQQEPKRSRNESEDEPSIQNVQPSGFRWRLKPKTAAKALQLIEKLKMKDLSCRDLAAITGTIIWRLYITMVPLVEGHEVIAIASEVSKTAGKHSWDCKMQVTEDMRRQLTDHLNLVAKNAWVSAPSRTDGHVFLASDASSEGRGAWVVFADEGRELHYKYTNNWSAEEKDKKIFYLELLSATLAIEDVQKEGVTIVIAIDNTAAAAVLRNMYSSTEKGRGLVRRVLAVLKKKNNGLIVAGIAGEDNYADAPTRGDPLKPVWQPIRRETTWRTLQEALEGTERRSLNPKTCPTSHIANPEHAEELEGEEDEEEDDLVVKKHEQITILLSEGTKI